jgi:hypothetical protein
LGHRTNSQQPKTKSEALSQVHTFVFPLSAPHFPVRPYFLSVMAGILTFPSLLYLPDHWPVALYKQTLQRGITAAGTVLDSHQIPLHRGGIGRQIAIIGCKGTK